MNDYLLLYCSMNIYLGFHFLNVQLQKISTPLPWKEMEIPVERERGSFELEILKEMFGA